MVSNSVQLTDILAYFFLILAYVSIPCLTFLAYRGQKNHLRSELAKWRVALSFASLLLTTGNWLLLLFIIFSSRNGFILGSIGDWVLISLLAAMASAILALTGKGPARIQAVTAALLIAAIWIVGTVRDEVHPPRSDQVPTANHYSLVHPR